MYVLNKYSTYLLLLLLTACVTINVYFPAAAAEHAADRIIKEVYGDENAGVPEEDPMPDPDQSSNTIKSVSNLLGVILEYVIPAAYAQQPDINISTPAIGKLKSIMKGRHQKLSMYYKNGAVGMENNGLITIRDQKAVALKERNIVKKLIAEENRDRNALYVEIAKANGHPEWEKAIRKTFSRRWIANAPAGWWYKGAGGKWTRK